MSRRGLLAALGVLALALAWMFGEGLARAAGGKTTIVEISVIHATRSDGGVTIDPQLRDLPQLTKEQPFVRYNVFKLLDRRQLPCEKGKPAAYALVDGRTLQVTLIDVTEKSSDQRYHLRAEIAGAGKKEFLKLLEVTASANEPFFVGGQSYQGGTLFLELVVRAG
jgi:hypothetical protein